VSKCPVCGAKASRVISGGQGVIFKGSGFYITDYGKNGKGPRKESDSAQAAEAKSESKPDVASSAKSGSGSDAASEVKAGAKRSAPADP
ncbi:MAG: FmdB family zinc ribbon protein, partial [Gemmatimonadales bacterium]